MNVIVYTGGMIKNTSWALSTEDKQNIVDQYKAGWSCQQLGQDYGIRSNAVWALLVRRGIATRKQTETQRKYSLNEGAFLNPSRDASYWLGFLMADGCVSEQDGRARCVIVQLSSKDKEHLEKLLLFLGSNALVKSRNNGQYARIHLWSEPLAESLAARGITPRKTHTAEATPEYAQDSDFWRGVVDGDGTVGSYRSTGGTTLYPRIQLVGSRSLVDQFLTWAKTVEPRLTTTCRPHKSIWVAVWTGAKALTVIDALYRDAPTALTRKADIANRILQGTPSDV